MPLPIIEQIVADLVTAIEAVTTTNNYEITVDEVYRPLTIDGFGRTPPRNYVVQLVLDDPEVDEELGFQGNPPRVGWSQPVVLDLIYRPSDTSDEPVQKTLEIFYAEVVRGIMADPQRSGLAVDSNLSAPQNWVDDGEGKAGKSLIYTIRYRHQENNPTAA